MLIHDHLKAFFYFFLLGLIHFLKMGSHCPVFCLGLLRKGIHSEEFPFENINNLTFGQGLKIFNSDFAENTRLYLVWHLGSYE